MRWLFMTMGLLCGCGSVALADASNGDGSPGPDAVDAASRADVVGDGPGADVTQFAQVVDILRNNCSGYCHAGGVDVGASLVFELPDGGMTDLTTLMSRQVTRMRIVVPGDPAASYLMIKLENTMHTLPECAGTASPCGVAMPWTGATTTTLLLPAERAVIRAWIEAGASTTGP